MLVTSSATRTRTPGQPPVSTRLSRWFPRPATSLFLLVCLLLTGCEAVAKRDAGPTELAPSASLDDLRVATKERLRECLVAFYNDDWEALSLHQRELAGLVPQWNAQRPGPGKRAWFRGQTRGLDQAVELLGEASQRHDVVAATVALERLADHLANLTSKNESPE
ncbi:hypothetical protein Pan216_46550 [Planctomycetes bacterium Pan216]|uniref:Uncharacterized protein n=1 Tax=Kolteria novifilia TaxID=2527975 RepID=A0A518B9W5_9BACT|nr:hypothetical protein Pan216_46550 [Planctomycetes bacterium Pan216]